MKTLWWKYTRKTLKVIGISIGVLLLLLFLLPVLFPGQIETRVKNWVNQHLDTKVNFAKTQLTFFKHFPSLTVSLHEFSMTGAAPFQQDTLLAAKEISLGINLKSLLFEKETSINKIFVSEAAIKVQVNKAGAANYNVYQASDQKENTKTADSAGAALKLEQIIFDDCSLNYNDQSVGIKVVAHQLNYVGSGNLADALFDLKSKLTAADVDFYLNDIPYLRDKKVQADLLTRINTHSLSFIFENNEIQINQLPVSFKGSLVFLADGYGLDFTAGSTDAPLYDLITALPPQYLQWLEKTKIKGDADIALTLKGNYNAQSGEMPGLGFRFEVRNGYVKYADAPAPVENLQLKMEANLPSLDMEKATLDVHNFNFNLAQSKADMQLHTLGFTQPKIKAMLKANVDLGLLDKALGIASLDMQGNLKLNLQADGSYASYTSQRIRPVKTTITSIPVFTFEAALQNGKLQFEGLSVPITNIGFNLKANCADHQYEHTKIELSQFNAQASNNQITGSFLFSNWVEKWVNADVKAAINLSEVRSFIPLGPLVLQGKLDAAITAKGNWQPEKKLMPAINGQLIIDGGSIQTPYYPAPVSNLQLQAFMKGVGTDLSAMAIEVKKLSFVFEAHPFDLQLKLANFKDIQYEVAAKGEVNLGNIYRVFSQKGIDVSGNMHTNFALKGKQSDALEGRYHLLQQEGMVGFDSLRTTIDWLPLPILIDKARFRFKQEKMWMEECDLRYGKSSLQAKGYLQQAVEYVLNGGELKGRLKLVGKKIDVDELMYFGTPDTIGQKVNATSAASGVMVLPENIVFQLKAELDTLRVKGLDLNSVAGQAKLSRGKLTFTQTGFKVAGAKVEMDGSYQASGPDKAQFEYHVKADSFDVKRAYNEIRLFRELASSAASIQGMMGLDYQLRGSLDSNMMPILPSLSGGGTVLLSGIKFKNFKLLNAISKKTGRDSLSNPSVKQITIKSSLSKNLFQLSRFKIKIFGFRLRCEGAATLDGLLQLKMRLGLPPLGIIGIPMRVTGTAENPKIKLGRGDESALPETELED